MPFTAPLNVGVIGLSELATEIAVEKQSLLLASNNEFVMASRMCMLVIEIFYPVLTDIRFKVCCKNENFVVNSKQVRVNCAKSSCE